MSLLGLFIFLDKVLQVTGGRTIQTGAHVIASDELRLVVMSLILALHHVSGCLGVLLGVKSRCLVVVSILN